jgi:hypothetical protein
MADLEIKGVVLQLLEIKQGVGQENKGWRKQEVIIETSDKFPKKVCIGVWNDLIKPYKIGSEITVKFNIISKEYNGKYYTEVKAWKIDGEIESISNNAQVEKTDDLPF